MQSNRNLLVGENGKPRKLIPVMFALMGMIVVSALIMAGSFSVVSSSSSSSSTSGNSSIFNSSSSSSFTSASSSNATSSISSVTTVSPIRIKETEPISATNAAAVGITVTNNDIAFIQFVADVGDEVIVKFDIINESASAGAIVVAVATDPHTIASVDENGSDFTTIRLQGPNKWSANFKSTTISGAADTLALSIASLEPGSHSVTVAIESV